MSAVPADGTASSAAGTIAVVAFGDPVLDVVAHVSHLYLQQLTPEAGGCLSISGAEMQELLSRPEIATDTIR